LVGEDPLVRHVDEFDVKERRYKPNLQKREIVDLLHIRDKDKISETPFRAGDFGLGDPFKFPYQTVEAVLPLSGTALAFDNHSNFDSPGRNGSLPDYSDFIIVKVPGIKN